MSILLKNVNIVDAGCDYIADVLIKDKYIAKIGQDLDPYDNDNVFNCTGLTLMPSFVDLHAHFRQPGFEQKETVKTGSLAALKGGYTLVNLMANTKPVANDMVVVDFVLEESKRLDLINVHQTASVTNDFDGVSLEHLKDIDGEKVLFISDDGRGIVSNKTSYLSMKFAKENGFVIMTHAEDKELTPIDYRLSEDVITIRDLYLCKMTGARLHMSHVSTKDSINAIKIAKDHFTNVTCEVTPHHLSLYDNDFRVNPPIRTSSDVDTIIKAIKTGVVDAISTDHAPHTAQDKQNGAPGLVGLETAFCVCYSTLVKSGHISLNHLSSLMSLNPYKIFQNRYPNRGLIRENYIADLTLIDLNKKIKVDPENFATKGRATPFAGKEFYGDIKMTLRDGIIKYNNF